MLGLWIARFTNRGKEGTEPRRLTLWHFVESEIEDRKVTACGRQMGDIEGTVLAPLVAPPTVHVACHACKGAKDG